MGALVLTVAAAVGFVIDSSHVSAATTPPIESGRFVWHDLMTKDVSAAKRFYGDLFGWRFEDTKRGDRAYVLARLGSDPVGGFVDVRALDNAGPQWISFMSVTDVDKTVAQVEADGGKVLLAPRDVPSVARAAVIADPQGAPLGLARLRRSLPGPAQPTPGHFFWQEYLARDVTQALAFYKRVAGYESSVTDSRLGVDYHVLLRRPGGAGLFLLPDTATDVEPLWLPYVLVSDPAALAARVPGLGGRILVPVAPEHRNSSVAVIADPGGAPLALQKYPF
jgi:hypothetical protein